MVRSDQAKRRHGLLMAFSSKGGLWRDPDAFRLCDGWGTSLGFPFLTVKWGHPDLLRLPNKIIRP